MDASMHVVSISPLRESPQLPADVELQAPEDAITSLAFHPSDPNRLLVSSWDAVRAILTPEYLVRILQD